jgi:Flp pilus assembly protein TadG
MWKHVIRARMSISSMWGDERGAAMMIFALAVVPMIIICGVAIDYTRAAMVRGKLAAIADASVLVGTTPVMMANTSTQARTAVINMFASQASLISASTYNAANLTVGVTDTTTTNGTQRVVALTYTASVQNFFALFESLASLTFTVSSTASANTAPNINFYVLLDNSASMEIPATTAGINTLQNATGCALACHENDYKDPELNAYPGWGTIDSYTYAENNGIVLRIDNVR